MTEKKAAQKQTSLVAGWHDYTATIAGKAHAIKARPRPEGHVSVEVHKGGADLAGTKSMAFADQEWTVTASTVDERGVYLARVARA